MAAAQPENIKMASCEAIFASSLEKRWGSASRSGLEIGLRLLLWLCTSISIVTTIGIVVVLITQVWSFFSEVALADFIFGTNWSALIEPKSFGVWPLILGTLMVGVGASLFAVPIGLGCAFFLSEYCEGKTKEILKSLVEILAGVPSVVYGFFAISFVTPFLRNFFPEIQFFNALSASIVVGMMIIPTIASIGHDAFQMVPRELKEAGYGLGARKYQVCLTIVFPAALSGFIASVILAFSRAIGETMAVTLAAGATPKLTLNPLESIQTITSYIVQVSLGDTPAGTIEYSSIYAVGVVLFLMTLSTNLIAQLVVHRFQEKYH